jgi:hypothetical protein
MLHCARTVSNCPNDRHCKFLNDRESYSITCRTRGNKRVRKKARHFLNKEWDAVRALGNVLPNTLRERRG